MYVNGKWVRSESGRVVQSGDIWACNASRKDARDAVSAAVAATSSWGSTRAILRGMILYRLGESLAFRSEIDGHEAIAKRAVWWAGWSEKLQMVSGSVNPVSGYLSATSIEPNGVCVALVDGETASEVAWRVIDVIGAALCGGNTMCVVVPCRWADVAQTISEVIAVSDIPAGVVGILTTDDAECVRTFASHGEVTTLHGAMCQSFGVSAQELLELGEDHLQRFSAQQHPNDSVSFALWMCDHKTVWHPVHV
jgi:acyl-CoA reductase-like NAD-dependent aldehyde dehydrogenase